MGKSLWKWISQTLLLSAPVCLYLLLFPVLTIGPSSLTMAVGSPTFRWWFDCIVILGFEFNSDLPLLNFRLLTHQMNCFLATWDRQTFLSNFFCIENSRICCLCRDLKWTWGWQNCYCRITCFSNQLNNFLHCQLISCEKELTMIYYCIYFLLWKSECHISGVHNYSPKIQFSGKAVVSQNLSGSLDFVTEKLMHTLQ